MDYPRMPCCNVCKTRPCCCPPVRKEQRVNPCPPAGSFSDFSTCRETCVNASPCVPPSLPTLLCNLCNRHPCCCNQQHVPPPPPPVCHTCGFNPCQCHTVPIPDIRSNIGADMYDDYPKFQQQQQQPLQYSYGGGPSSILESQREAAMELLNQDSDESGRRGIKALDPTDPNQRVTRIVMVDAYFSLSDAQKDSSVATWRLRNGTVFQTKPINSSRHNMRCGDLSTIILAHVSVISASSEHQPPLGMCLSFVKGNMYNCYGDRYAYIITQKEESWGKHGLTIFNPKKIIGSAFVSKYAGLTKESMDMGVETHTKRVMKDGQIVTVTYKSVPMDNIIIHLININPDQFQFSLYDMTLHHGKYELEESFYNIMRKMAIEKVLDNLPYANLSPEKLHAYFKRADVPRADKRHFLSESGALSAAANNDQLAHTWMDIPRSVKLKLRFDYMITKA